MTTRRARPVVATPQVGVVTGAVRVGVSQQTTWDYVTDWELQGEWIPATTVRVVGDQIVAVTGVGPVRVTDTMHVVRSDPPRVCEVAHTGRLISGTGLFTCEPTDDGGTLFSWEERVRVPGGAVAGVVWRLASPVLRISYGIALGRLRRRLESRHAG